MNNEWFECKVKYEKTMENGLVKKVTEPYLVDALNFTEAEARIIEEITPFMTGAFEVSDIKRAHYAELFEAPGDDSADKFSVPNCSLSHSTKEWQGEEDLAECACAGCRFARFNQAP